LARKFSRYTLFFAFLETSVELQLAFSGILAFLLAQRRVAATEGNDKKQF